MALKILKADQEHSLDEHCLVGAALSMLSENISVNRDEVITSLASRIGRDTKKELDGMTSSRGKMEGEDLTPAQTNTMKEIFSSFLEPWSDPSSRCASCLRCSSCAPIQLLSQQQKIEKLKGRENWELKQNISIAQDPEDPEKLRVVCNLPVDMSKIAEKLSSNNLESAISEYDRKMCGLTTTDKTQLETEFLKMVDNEYYKEISSYSPEIQKEIWGAPILNFVSVAPAWKLQSLSTKCRAALNFGKRSKKSGLSLNDISVGGRAPLDMSRTARFFKSKKGLAVGDISKFFQQVFISKSSPPPAPGLEKEW